MNAVAALFVQRRSHYKAMSGVDCYDADRDALTWRGGVPGIFHPPCRGWGKLAGMAKCRPGELDLALWAVSMCRQFGGVVEHPLHSRLWSAVGCLRPGIRDRHDGVLVTVMQGDYGHRAPKATGLYIVGASVPAVPFDLATREGRIERMGWVERERTPVAFAALLVALARSVGGAGV